MFWALISLFFCWLIYRELTSPKVAMVGFGWFDFFYTAVLIFLAVLFAWRPVHYWRFETFLTAEARELTEGRPTVVHCNTVFDTIFDDEIHVAGHENFETGDIVMQLPWCEHLMDYLEHPEHATDDEIYSLAVFTHESMHARGEYNESKTECEAVQRNYRAEKLLGVPDDIAKRNALYYYNNLYINHHGYFTRDCAPDGLMDEHLSDSTWRISSNKLFWKP